jgi:hypothetical protein
MEGSKPRCSGVETAQRRASEEAARPPRNSTVGAEEVTRGRLPRRAGIEKRRKKKKRRRRRRSPCGRFRRRAGIERRKKKESRDCGLTIADCLSARRQRRGAPGRSAFRDLQSASCVPYVPGRRGERLARPNGRCC